MQITGRITADAKIHTLKDDRKVVNFTLAVNDGYKNKSGEWVGLTEFYRCAYWLSSKMAKALTKGRLVELTGRASASAWTNREGEPRANLNFHTSGIKFHDAKRKAGAKRDQVNSTDQATDIDDDLPF